MGADFIRRRARAFRKAWDTGAVALAEETLFTRDAGPVVASTVTRLVPGATVSVGDCLIVRLDERQLRVYEGMRLVAECVDPSMAVIAQVERGGYIAEGHVLTVNPTGGYAELSLC